MRDGSKSAPSSAAASETRDEEPELLKLDADGEGDGKAGSARFRSERGDKGRLAEDELALVVEIILHRERE